MNADSNIATTIIAALLSGAATGACTVGENAVVDTYDALKSLIKRKFGVDSDLSHALNKLEANPDSAGRQLILQEEVIKSKVDEDAVINKISANLLALLEGKYARTSL
jgi:hypothetical protein